MACAAEHAQFNLFAVMATTAVVRSHETGILDGIPVAMGVATALLPSLPDLLEPAVHPNHRGFFHSVAMGVAVAYGMRRAYRWETKSDWERLARVVAMVGCAAYIGHLVRDAFSAKSLPLV